MNERAQNAVDVAIIGFPKCGTTTVQRYVGEHPDLATHEQLECSFFRLDTEFELGWEKVFPRYFTGVGSGAAKVIKNASLIYSRPGVARLKLHNPDAKVITVMRHPGDRTFSSFQHEVQYGAQEEYAFDAYVDDLLAARVSSRSYRIHIENSFYEEWLHSLFRCFSRDQVKILIFEEMARAGPEYWEDVFRFLGVSAFVPDLSVRHNESGRVRSRRLAAWTNVFLREGLPHKRLAKWLLGHQRAARLGTQLRRSNLKPGKAVLSPESRQKLARFFRNDIAGIETILGRSIDCWNRTDSV